MKHDEFYDKHADHRKSAKGGRSRFKEGVDKEARMKRVSFKNYVRSLDEQMQEEDAFEDYTIGDE
jgi:hypothetical protein